MGVYFSCCRNRARNEEGEPLLICAGSKVDKVADMIFAAPTGKK